LYLSSNSKLRDFQSKKEEILKLRDKIDSEKEIVKLKVEKLKLTSPIKKSRRTKSDIESGNEDISPDISIGINHKAIDSDYLTDIHSDVEKQSVGLKVVSDNTSFLSSLSEIDKNLSDVPNENKSKDFNTKDQREQYKEFVKVFLKVKFEHLNSKHAGQSIQQSKVWKEIQKKQVKQDDWERAILDELNTHGKYDSPKKNKKKR
jgi:hypothetical protein